MGISNKIEEKSNLINQQEIQEIDSLLTSIPDISTVNFKLDSVQNSSFSKKINTFQNFYQAYPNLNSSQALDSLDYQKTFWNTFFYQQVINIHKNIQQSKTDGGKSYVKTLTSYISISLFVFLPLFTLFLKLLYIRRKFTYMEHLVFVFHTQTVFFLLFILFYILDLFVKTTAFSWVFTLLFLVYLYKALRYFYQQSRRKTILKFVILNSFYLFLAGVGFTLIAMLSFAAG